MAKNGAENGAAPKAKIAKKVGRRTKCTEDYVPRFLERIEAGKSVPAAAAVAGLHISTVMEWLTRVNPGKFGCLLVKSAPQFKAGLRKFTLSPYG